MSARWTRSRKAQGSPAESHDRWLVSYADFITLLFAFFTVLYATSEANVEKARGFEQSINRYLIKAGAFGESGADINQGQIHNSPIDQPIQTFPQSKPETQDTQKKIETLVESQIGRRDLEKFLRDISNDAQGVRISLAAEQIFPDQSARLKREALPVLNTLARALAELPFRIMVEGHSRAATSANYPSHWELSANRATTLVRYLIKVHNFSADRLGASALPPENAEGPHARAFEDRVDFLILTE